MRDVEGNKGCVCPTKDDDEEMIAGVTSDRERERESNRSLN